MEAREAICILKRAYKGTPTTDQIEALEKAYNALDKQIPMTPIKNRTQYIRYTSAYSCPRCGDGFAGTGIADYCYHCGQKLDWDKIM